MKQTYAERLKNINAKSISINELKDIRYSLVNINLSKEDKMFEYIAYIKNLFLYRHKDYKVRTFFEDDTCQSSLEENLTNVIRNF